MKSLFHYLGSVYFAVTLILSTLLFVILGTILESWSDSHLFASHFTYHNPLFTSLLWLYFLNILFAALRRYPFRVRHIPFLITHLGLLMLLAGALVKNLFGLQGVMGICEGMAMDRVFLPHTHALYIENRAQGVVVPIEQRQKGSISTPFEGLELTLLDWTPHAREELKGWIYDNALHLIGFPPLPIQDTTRPVLKSPDYTIWALRSSSLEEVSEKLANQRNSIVFINVSSGLSSSDSKNKSNVPEDEIVKNQTQIINKKEALYLWAVNGKGEQYAKELKDDMVMIFDKGYRGYGYFAQLPPSFPQLELITPIQRTSVVEKALHKKEELKPSIRLLVTYGGKSEIVQLTYDPYASHFKWPIADGHYLIRFQSRSKTIPHTLRLHQAREICYPQTNQPMSYESDVEIEETFSTISMNHVYETKKHYRFYMSNLWTPTPFSAPRVQIVVNRDPGKYYLTYPGGVLLALGIVLLYLRKAYA
ncbi:MAG: hypothetical protein ACKVOH_03135 [Chlamydiales bacterium]